MNRTASPFADVQVRGTRTTYTLQHKLAWQRLWRTSAVIEVVDYLADDETGRAAFSSADLTYYQIRHKKSVRWPKRSSSHWLPLDEVPTFVRRWVLEQQASDPTDHLVRVAYSHSTVSF